MDAQTVLQYTTAAIAIASAVGGAVAWLASRQAMHEELSRKIAETAMTMLSPLEERIERLEQENGFLRDRVTTLEREKTELRTEVDRLERENQELRGLIGERARRAPRKPAA